MILMASYRDDLIDLIHQEPKETFAILHTTKQTVLESNDVLDQMWPLYQKAVEEYNEDPRRAMVQILTDTWPNRMAQNHLKTRNLGPNEIWACGFKINSKGGFALDLKPTLGLKCSSQWSDMEQAFNENPSIPKSIFRPYNKAGTNLKRKKYNLRAIHTFKSKRACYLKYNELVQESTDRCQALLNTLYIKTIPDFIVDKECGAEQS